jgi:hypothetical protein
VTQGILHGHNDEARTLPQYSLSLCLKVTTHSSPLPCDEDKKMLIQSLELEQKM